jgi:hypothetical protein
MNYRKLFKNGAEFCAISSLVITRGRALFEEGVPVGQDPDTCVFITDKAIVGLKPLTDVFAIVDPTSGSARSLKIQRVGNGHNVSGLLEE